MGPPGNNDTICLSLMLIYISLRKTKTGNKYIVISSLTLLQIQRNLQRSWNYQTAGNTYWRKVQGTFVVYLPLSYLLKPPLCRLSAIRCIVPHSQYSLLSQYPCYIHRLKNYDTTNIEATYSLLFVYYYLMFDLTFTILLISKTHFFHSTKL